PTEATTRTRDGRPHFKCTDVRLDAIGIV
ncbi:unnamed protein product, partial [Adineta ricciae]